MQKAIHPQWFPEAVVKCAGCGNTFTFGATIPAFQVDVCYNCHPFYTGQMKFVDTAGRVDAFMAKAGKATGKKMSKSEKRKIKEEKRLQKELEKPETLEELRKKVNKKKS